MSVLSSLLVALHKSKKVDLQGLLEQYKNHPKVKLIQEALSRGDNKHLHLSGLFGSSLAFVTATLANLQGGVHLCVLRDTEEAAYFLNNLENVFGEQKVLFVPSSYKKEYNPNDTDPAQVLLRAEALNRLRKSSDALIVVTYPEALCEKVVTRSNLEKNIIDIKLGEEMSMDSVVEFLRSYDFERTDFVLEPGQFSVRGGILDIFSFANELPYRLSFSGDTIEAIRLFEPESQLSVRNLGSITIIPNVQKGLNEERRESFLDFIPANAKVWLKNTKQVAEIAGHFFARAKELNPDQEAHNPDDFLEDATRIVERLQKFTTLEVGGQGYFKPAVEIAFDTQAQPAFNKNFNMLSEVLHTNKKQRYTNFIFADNARQIERIYAIFADLRLKEASSTGEEHLFISMLLSIHEGFIDRDLKIACYTDHQIFDRYHRYRLKKSYSKSAAITLKELSELKPGDFVTHIDHGVGKYGGLEKVQVNGKEQEAIRLVYKDNDILYISIHALHRISKFSGKEGEVPSMNKLGSASWSNLKAKTKKRVKDIARDLIQLYAKRKAQPGFAYTPDTYLQNELEASFIYEDTPDQYKATVDVKKDMENSSPMDRLVCGDVGFGKTEIAIRAAFKAVADGKQVAVLVPTTILALQHFKTFSARLKELPVTVDFINRFRTAKEQKEIIKKLGEGKVDILIGTHKLLSKEIAFKDLGLLIIDEEQKFGVAAKDKLKALKVNVDTLTLTATPIPRTLQFSMMGARDLSIINTPPPNRHPVTTELHVFTEDIIREAVNFELQRGGQVFFVNNRIQNLHEIAGLIQRLCPEARIRVGHGQMDGDKLEEIMLSFIEGDCDVLISTTIIESGLDIPNANTILINEAQNFGLSDLHQMRGRVGRSNKKAFCYLLAPPLSVLTPLAKQRLQALEQFSELGSGIQIAMRDLDIRGAGNLLGGEQSGFITELGFEMYHKILDEAIRALKATDFKELFSDQQANRPFVEECLVESDLEILIPDHYVESITERLHLYKELDDIAEPERLEAFAKNLEDRFGPLPRQVHDLLNTVRLRWVARDLGFEKIVLKNDRFMCFFVSDQNSLYYKSPMFMNTMRYLQQRKEAKLREDKQKLTLLFGEVKSVAQAHAILAGVQRAVTEQSA